jgi:hypothetical protein
MTRIIAGFLAAMLAAVAGASAEEVIVKNSNAALRATPSKDGKIEWRVNDGYQLTVVDRQDNWIEVRAPNLPEPNDKLWIQAKQVAPAEPPPSEDVIAADFRLELTGSLGAEFKSKCVFLEAGDNFRHVRWDHGPMPAHVDLDGASVLCIVRTRGSIGRVSATLLDRDGKAIAAAGTGGYATSVVVRSNGPWGSAASKVGGGSYAVTIGAPLASAGSY